MGTEGRVMASITIRLYRMDYPEFRRRGLTVGSGAIVAVHEAAERITPRQSAA